MKRFHDEHIVPLALNGAPIPNSHAWTMDILGGGDEEVCLQKKFPLWTGVVAGIGVGLIAEHFVTSLDFPDAAQIQRCPAAQV